MIGSDSPGPFVKPDPDELLYANAMNSYTNNGRQGFWQQTQNFDNYNYVSPPNNGILLKPTFGSQQNLNSSFMDEELSELIDYDPQATQSQTSHALFSPTDRDDSLGSNNNAIIGRSGNDGSGNGNMYHSQPLFNGLRNMSAPAQHMHGFSPQSPLDPRRQNNFGQTFDQSNLHFGHRQQITSQYQNMHRLSNGSGSLGDPGRAGSTSLSPISSTNPKLAHLQLGTSDTSSLGMQPIPNRGHRSSSSATQWDTAFSITGSPNNDTPLTSPMSGPGAQRQLSSILENSKSLPTRSKTLPHKAQSVPSAGMSKEEQKKAKRRYAHNVVEQKRRDKINERIQELSNLVPIHRLEDNKRVKQLASQARNASNGLSPNSSSIRRSASISQPATIDERDKTKGNSLDSAVTWTRDLMWLLQRMVEQQTLLIENLESMGGQVPFEIRDDEARMRSELEVALKQNVEDIFEYSRRNGTGLYVPDYTDVVGGALTNSGEPEHEFTHPFQSPDIRDFNSGENQLWDYPTHSGRDSLDFTETEGFNMDLN